jgi:hypothetical protein
MLHRRGSPHLSFFILLSVYEEPLSLIRSSNSEIASGLIALKAAQSTFLSVCVLRSLSGRTYLTLTLLEYLD